MRNHGRRKNADRSVLKILRIHTEPSKYMSDPEVHRILTRSPTQYLSYLEKKLFQIAHHQAKIELPKKKVFWDKDGDFRVMPCIFRTRSSTFKTVKIVGTNKIQKKVPDQITVGRAFRLDPKENFITHIFDACLLSSARTAALATIAAKHLSYRKPRHITIIGAGRVGFYSAFYLSYLNRLKTISFYDPNETRIKKTLKFLYNYLPRSRRPTIVMNKGLSTSDIVITASTSHRILLKPSDTSAPLVISLGADSHDQHELSPLWLKVSAIFTDTIDSLNTGDLKKWLAKGLVQNNQITTLLDTLSHGCRPSRYERRIFISTGSAIMDNLTIAYLISREPS